MKRLFIKRMSLFFLSSFLIFNNIGLNGYSFSSATHRYTTQRGLSILDDVKGGEFSKFYGDKDRKQLLFYCVQPDEDESDGAYKYHFYNPATEKNFMGENDSALTRCSRHYRNAIYHFKSGNKDVAFEELGRSLHFLEDLCTPVHTNNQDLLDTAFNLSFHVSFEDKCEKTQDGVVSSLLDKEFGYYKNNTLTNIAKSCAYLANDNFFALYEKLLPKESVAENSIKNAQKSVAGVLYKFYLDVN